MDRLAFVNENMLPFAEVLGIEFKIAEPDRIVAEMTVRDELCTIPAVLHGGAIMAFADTLGGVATILNLPEGSGTTTIESKTNFLGPAPTRNPRDRRGDAGPSGPPDDGVANQDHARGREVRRAGDADPTGAVSRRPA